MLHRRTDEQGEKNKDDELDLVPRQLHCFGGRTRSNGCLPRMNVEK